VTTPYCPACAGTDSRPLLSAPLHPVSGSAPVLSCRSCGHRWLAVSADQQEAINGLYAEDYAGFRDDPVFSRVVRDEIASTIAPHVPPPASVLDVGCGNGTFLHLASEAGYRARGLDVSPAAADSCRKRGLHASAGDFLRADLPQFDLVTFWDVLEHLRDPRAFLLRARSLLRPGGRVLIKVPGLGTAFFPLLAAQPRLTRVMLGTPGHVQFFSPRSLAALLRACGLSAAEWRPAMHFRSPRPARSWKHRAAQLLQTSPLAGRGNLYVIAALSGSRSEAPGSRSRARHPRSSA
jgi:2-polyprenyl-3-methyl-5-hydroxy-6-metoxy-1,4-benzoquinol methylase